MLNGSDEESVLFFDREAPPNRACLPLSLLDPAFADSLPRRSHSHSQSAPSACVLSKTTALAMEGKANSTLALEDDELRAELANRVHLALRARMGSPFCKRAWCINDSQAQASVRSMQSLQSVMRRVWTAVARHSERQSEVLLASKKNSTHSSSTPRTARVARPPASGYGHCCWHS